MPTRQASPRTGLTLRRGAAIAARPEPCSPSPAVPPTCPKHRSTAVIHGQPRSLPMPSELEDQPVQSDPRMLPKLAVRVRFPSPAPPQAQVNTPEALHALRAARSSLTPLLQLTRPRGRRRRRRRQPARAGYARRPSTWSTGRRAPTGWGQAERPSSEQQRGCMDSKQPSHSAGRALDRAARPASVRTSLPMRAESSGLSTSGRTRKTSSASSNGAVNSSVFPSLSGSTRRAAWPGRGCSTSTLRSFSKRP